MKMLGTKTGVKLMNILLKNPLREYKEIELIREAKTGKGAASTCLNRLKEEFILLERKVGKAKVYSLNLQNSSVFFLKNLFDQEKIKALPEEKKAAIFLFKQKVREKVLFLAVFGSTIAGTATPESDIDLLVVSVDDKTIEKEKKEVEELFGERLNLHHYVPEMVKIKDSFIQNILLKGVILQGYDFGRGLFLSLQEKKDKERLFFLKERIQAAYRNYHQKDYGAAKEVIERTLEQLIFYFLTNKSIPYASKTDALRTVSRLPEGKIIQKINKSSLEEKMKLIQYLVLKELQQRIIKEEGYA